MLQRAFCNYPRTTRDSQLLAQATTICVRSFLKRLRAAKRPRRYDLYYDEILDIRRSR